MNKASGGDDIPAELFSILKDDAVKELHSIWQQIWKTQEWPQDWKKSLFIPIPKKGNTRYSDDTCLIAEIENHSLIWFHQITLDESERGAWKADLKLSIQKTKITACGTIMSWQTEGEKVETVTDFIFLHFKITVDSDCSHEIKRCLLLGRKAMTILGSVLKSRDITFLTKVHECHVISVVSKFLWPYEL